ncbi:Uncharacterised protein [Candidatus Gugararchaeum adminiculabundum]|nr:Uncharacterised protein [Candidatus Gugararchaeum adminiculabundum]
MAHKFPGPQRGGGSFETRIKPLPGGGSEYTDSPRFPLFKQGAVIFENPDQALNFFSARYGDWRKARELIQSIKYEISLEGLKKLIKKSPTLADLARNIENKNFKNPALDEDPLFHKSKFESEAFQLGSNRLGLSVNKDKII